MIFYFSGAETAGTLIDEILGPDAHRMNTYYKFHKTPKKKKGKTNAARKSKTIRAAKKSVRVRRSKGS